MDSSVWLYAPTIKYRNNLITSDINRASGCSFYNLALTASEAIPATWGPVKYPNKYNRGAVAHPAAKDYLRTMPKV
ncbi:MAG: hypothetical protein ACI30V_10510 [Muribaculaceae bacterium]